MEKQQHFYQSAMSLLLVIGGNMLYALAVKLFLLPSGLVTGGTTRYCAGDESCVWDSGVYVCAGV